MAFRSSSLLSGAGTNGAAVPVPSGAAVNDIAVVGIYIEDTVTITPPSGFTLKADLRTSATARGGLVVYWKRLTAADSGTYSFTWTGTPWRGAACGLWSGRATSGDPFDGTVGTAESTSGVTTLNVSTSPAGADGDALGFWTSFNGGTSFTPPTNYTERADNNDVITLDTRDAVASGSTGSVSATANITDFMKAFLGVLALGASTGADLNPIWFPGFMTGNAFPGFMLPASRPINPAALPYDTGAVGGLAPVAINPALETDAVQALGRVKTKAIGTALETDTPQAFGARRSRLIGIATEPDAAVSVARSKKRTAGIITETDTAQLLGRRKTDLIGVATEADEAAPITRFVPALGIALETDTAQPFGRRKAKAIGAATETDVPVSLTRVHRRTLGVTAETDTAVAFARTHRRTVGVVAELDAAVQTGRRKRTTVGFAVETDTAAGFVMEGQQFNGTSVATVTGLQSAASVAGVAPLPLVEGKASTAFVTGLTSTAGVTHTGSSTPAVSDG